MKTLRLLMIFLRIGVLGELAYRINFIVRLFQSLLELGTAFAGLAVVFSYTDMLNGWRAAEVAALLGVFFLVGGVISFIIQPSMERFINSVREGTLDFTLIKPEDVQLLVSIQSVSIWSLIDIVLGLATLVIALVHLGGNLAAQQSAAFALMLISGAVIVYSFWLILATLAFWFVRVENILVIFQSMYEAGRWPVSIYPGWLRFGLTFIIPVAFATTVPVEALTSRLSTWVLIGAPLTAAVMLAASRLFFKAGVRHYSGASA